LQKDGWDVNEMPFTVAVVDRRPLYIDLYAERRMENELRAMVVIEIKCFFDPRSELNELYTAIG
jgi:XisH protein